MLPWNDSISVSINDVFAETCIRMGPSIKDDNVSINGVHVDLEKESRFSKLIVVCISLLSAHFDFFCFKYPLKFNTWALIFNIFI